MGRIPVLGRLFSSNAENGAKRVLFVFLRPTILRNRGDVTTVSTNRFQRLQSIETRAGDADEPPAGTQAGAPSAGGDRRPLLRPRDVRRKICLNLSRRDRATFESASRSASRQGENTVAPDGELASRPDKGEPVMKAPIVKNEDERAEVDVVAARRAFLMKSGLMAAGAAFAGVVGFAATARKPRRSPIRRS